MHQNNVQIKPNTFYKANCHHKQCMESNIIIKGARPQLFSGNPASLIGVYIQDVIFTSEYNYAR